MDAHNFRNETLELTNSNVLDSATVTYEDTQSIFIVTSNDNDSHGSAQVQDVLADVLSSLNNIYSKSKR
jgi:hypothetical protein